jgi:hypothetical protein
MVRLSDLAMAAFVYDSLSSFNSSLSRLTSATGGRVALHDGGHRLTIEAFGAILSFSVLRTLKLSMRA